MSRGQIICDPDSVGRTQRSGSLEGDLGSTSAERERIGGRIILSELPLQILERVEELVLYTLAQERRINAQQEQIAALQERLNAMENGGH